MNKLNRFALMSAIALTGAAGFTACSSEDELANTNPTFDGESVKTQFAINIPHAQGTRMSAGVTQDGDNTFRGMTNIRLVPFELQSTPTSASTPVQGTETLYYNAITLGDISKTDGLAENTNSKVYKDVDIAVGVNAFLFYGEATAETELDGLDAEQVNGVLNPSYKTDGLSEGDDLTGISFDLQDILGDGNVSSAQTVLLTMLNSIAAVKGTGDKAWSAVTSTESEALHDYYQSFIGMTAGSANSIRLALQDLYNALSSERVTDVAGLKAAIQAAIVGQNYSNFTVSDTEPNKTLIYATSFAGKDYPSALENYVYPASLYYWTNTSIKTATTPQGDNYAGKNDWNAVLNDLYTNTREVQATTQSVALEQTVNYGVGRLDLYAKFADGEILDAADEAVTLPTEGFQLTGILIGGQKSVGWNFVPTGTTEYTIYDAAVAANTNITRTLPSSPNNRTLVLETAGASESPYETVNIALEFVNNSNEAFEGFDGIVPIGGKFYLVGKITSNAEHNKVFEQDYYTTAKVTINSLENAYNCIPDLRTPKLELGLSVDLEWQQGLEADVVIN